jgi:hypothetical protein
MSYPVLCCPVLTRPALQCFIYTKMEKVVTIMYVQKSNDLAEQVRY